VLKLVVNLANPLKNGKSAQLDALAVLEEQGPYAMFLYIRARHREMYSSFESSLKELLKRILSLDERDVLDIAKRVAEDLDLLLFAHDLLRRALIYARFHLKARGGQ
jgi:hypothetical protein